MPSLAASARTALSALFLAAASVAGAHAQSAAGGATGTPPAIEGTWSGEFFVPQAQGPMTVTFARGDSAWIGNIELVATQSTMKAALRKIAADSAGVAFEATIDGADVTFTGKYEGAALVGTITAVQNGSTVAEGEWSARRDP